MTSGKPRFRPMMLGDFFDETLDLYKNNFILLATIAAVLELPIMFFMNMFQFKAIAAMPKTPSPNPSFGDFEAILHLYAVIFIASALYMLIYPIIVGVFTYAISRRYLGEPTTMSESYGFIFKRIAKVFFSIILSYFIANSAAILMIVLVAIAVNTKSLALGIFAGLLLIPASVLSAILSVKFVFVPAAVVVEDRGYFDAMRRSWNLITGHALRVFGISLLIGLIVGVMTSMITAPVGVLVALTTKPGVMSPWVPLQAVVNSLVQSAVAPLMMIVTVLLYFDVRIRKEGFDLQMLARDLAVASGQPVPDIVYPEPAVTVYKAPAEAEKPLSSATTTVLLHSLQPKDLCPSCGQLIISMADVVTCDGCERIYHGKCWDEAGGCHAPGCESNQTTSESN